MKTLHEVNKARKTLCERIDTEEFRRLNIEQQALICGMLNALVWAADGPDSTTIQRVLNNEPFGEPPCPR